MRDAEIGKGLASGPVRGPDCPLTYELLELALGRLAEGSARAGAILAHLEARCEYCGPRFAAQQRAVARLRQARPAAQQAHSGGCCRGKAWRGRIDRPALLAASGPVVRHEVEVKLVAPNGSELAGTLAYEASQGDPD